MPRRRRWRRRPRRRRWRRRPRRRRCRRRPRRWPMPRRRRPGRRRRRDRLHARRRFGPHQQHGARRVVDGETRRRPEAVRSEPAAVTVAGANQQIGVHRCLHHLPLHAALQRHAPRRPPEPMPRSLEQFRRRVRRKRFDQRSGIRMVVTAAEQPGERAVRGGGDVVAGDVQQRDLGAVVPPGGVDACRPRPLGHPHQHAHALSVP
jgi:hypothetical protein